MKFMKLGARPDTFFSPSESARSVYTEVATDLQILVGNCFYHLHKFPLLSKCLLLQALCAESGCGGDGDVIELAGFPGGAEAFEVCAKFCYGITITVSARNLAPLRCAAAHLGMSEAADRGNLAAKLDSFLASCLLRRWKDALAVLHSTRHNAPLCEELGLTSRCVDAVAVLIVMVDERCFPKPRSTMIPTEHGAKCNTFWFTSRNPKWPTSIVPSRHWILWNGRRMSAAMASSAQMQMSLCMSGKEESASSLWTFTLSLSPPQSVWYASSASPMSFRISDTSSSTTVTPSKPPPFTMAAAVWSFSCTMSTA